MRNAEAFARSIDKVAFDILSKGVGHGVHDHVEFSKAFFERGEELVEFGVLADVAHEGLGAGQGEDEVFGFLFQAFVLVSDGELHSGGVQALGDGPRDGALVGDSEDDGVAAFEVSEHGNSVR